MSDMLICVATMDHERFIKETLPTWEPFGFGDTLRVHDNTPDNNLGVVASYQALYENTRHPILGYLHDDLAIGESGWYDRVLREFEDPTVGVVGFGGAIRHGSDTLYKRPYRIDQLARFGYRSNTRDARAHGEIFTGECDVAVLDGFSLIVRRALLDKAGGWPVGKIRFHNYDYYACAIAHRYGYRVRLVGIDCLHHGGRTSVMPAYQEWLAKQGTTDAEDHAQAHVWFYNEFRDVMPWRCD